MRFIDLMGSVTPQQVPTYELNYEKVNTFADLPDVVANANEVFIVKQDSGTWLLGTKKKAGLYYSNGVSWNYMGNNVSIDDGITSNESVWSSSKVTSFLGTKANVSDVFTKQEIEALTLNYYTEADVNTMLTDYSTTSQTATLLEGKADLSNGKILLTQLPDSVLGQVEYKGTWNASTNTPNLTTVLPSGKYYITSVAGTFQSKTFEVGDWILSNGTTWDKVDNTDAVSSVNGLTGNVVITKSTISLGNVDNTSDASKPISTATQTALNNKANTATTLSGYGITDAISSTASQTAKYVLIAPNGANGAPTFRALLESDLPSLTIAKTTGLQTALDGKASTSVATTSVNGIMSSTDKTKLDGIAVGATNYTHPVNHPASIITQDASNRFVTDTEKTTWNGKVTANTAITAGTATKITYDAKGLVTAGASLLASDIPTLNQNTTGSSGSCTGNSATATSIAGGSIGTIPYQSGASTTAHLAVGTAGQYLKSNGASAPLWDTITMEDIPTSSYKASCIVATTANITLSGTQTIDGISVVAGDRVLVKEQTLPQENGIYVVNASTWTRALDADTSAEIAVGIVNVDSGTVNGGFTFKTRFKATDTLGTTAMNFVSFAVVDTTPIAGGFDTSTTTPTATNRLNYNGYFYPTALNLVGQGDTTTASTHYFVETGSDGFVRPKTLANVKAEIVPTYYTRGIGTSGITGATNYALFPAAADTITLAVGVYKVSCDFYVSVATSTVSATLGFNFRGAGTAVGNIYGTSRGTITNGGTPVQYSLGVALGTNVVVTAASAVAGRVHVVNVEAIVDVTTAGTIIPSYQWSATLTSGVVTLSALNNMVITKLADTAVTTFGGWA